MELNTKDRSFESIQTPRLSVMSITKVHLQDILHEKNSEQVNRYLAAKSANSLDELAKRIDGIMEKNQAKEIIQLEVIAQENNEFIWLCAIKKPNSGHPEIWLWIKEWAQWKGYGKELVEWLVDRIRCHLTYEYIIYETFEDNVWSVKIIESLWWVKQSEIEPKENYYGETLPHVQYRIYPWQHAAT